MSVNREKITGIIVVSLTIIFFNLFFSCTSDEEIKQTPVSATYLEEAKSTLKDSIVLNATAMMGTVNKTLLKEGCPAKYYFEWRGNDTLNIQMRNFSVGNMPVTVYFSCNCKFMQLNSWEKDEYTGEGWIKFEGSGGRTDYFDNEKDATNSYQDGTGGSGTVIGYFNAYTHQIEFAISFNVMNMTSEVYLQTVDSSRMANFDADFAQYEEDLAAYKKAHGL